MDAAIRAPVRRDNTILMIRSTGSAAGFKPAEIIFLRLNFAPDSASFSDPIYLFLQPNLPGLYLFLRPNLPRFSV